MILNADSIQGVLFTVQGTDQDDALKLWEMLFPNDQPDGFQRATSSPNLQSTASGERGGHNILITSQVGRVDLVVAPPAPSPVEDIISGVPRISDVTGAAEKVAVYMKQLAVRLAVSRIALVLDTAVTVPYNGEGSALAALLSGVPLPTNATEVVFQFNARRNFDTSPEVIMNRLCTWSSGQVGFIQGGPGVHLNRTVKMSPFVGLKIDINSAAETRITAEKCSSAIDELCVEALLIHNQGLARFQ